MAKVKVKKATIVNPVKGQKKGNRQIVVRLSPKRSQPRHGRTHFSFTYGSRRRRHHRRNPSFNAAFNVALGGWLNRKPSPPPPPPPSPLPISMSAAIDAVIEAARLAVMSGAAMGGVQSTSPPAAADFDKRSKNFEYGHYLDAVEISGGFKPTPPPLTSPHGLPAPLGSLLNSLRSFVQHSGSGSGAPSKSKTRKKGTR